MRFKIFTVLLALGLLIHPYLHANPFERLTTPTIKSNNVPQKIKLPQENLDLIAAGQLLDQNNAVNQSARTADIPIIQNQKRNNIINFGFVFDFSRASTAFRIKTPR